jgi:hypothetical protein
MDRINDLKDETIKTLAQTLKTSGLAASETEAIRMATNMAQTNKKVNTTFEDRKEKNIMGLSFLHKEYKKKEPQTETIQEEAYAQEETTKPTQENEGCEGCECSHENYEESLNEEKPLNELFEVETKDEFIEQELIKEDIAETTKEIPTQTKPKRDISEFKESKVDLGDVFKFKG